MDHFFFCQNFPIFSKTVLLFSTILRCAFIAAILPVLLFSCSTSFEDSSRSDSTMCLSFGQGLTILMILMILSWIYLLILQICSFIYLSCALQGIYLCQKQQSSPWPSSRILISPYFYLRRLIVLNISSTSSIQGWMIFSTCLLN